MKPKHFDLHIPDDGTEPFINCKLNRKQYAEVLTDIVSLYSDGFVLAVNNKWGTGKTTFIKMWEQQLKNSDFKTLYFNAWENDFEKDVLVALLAELEVLRDTETKAEFKKVLIKATPLLKKAGLGLVKGLAKKVGADELVQALIEGTAEATLEGLKNEMESYTNRKKGIQDFRETLETFVELLGNGKPVVFIIDELDRCRPNYAVEVLEQVKHLFSVSGIVFVLSIDKEQLGHAVRGVYGSDKIDAEEYLRRFIDLEYSIPEPSIKSFTEYLFGYYEFDKFYNNEHRLGNNSLRYEKDNFITVMQALFSNEKSSLRIQEKMFGHLRLILNSFSNDQYTLPEILGLLLYIKNYHLKIYKKIINKEYKAQDLINELDSLFNSITEEKERLAIVFSMGRFLFTYCNYIEQNGGKKLLIYVGNTVDIDLTSTIDSDKFKASFKYIANDFTLDTLDLIWILKRVELTEKLNL